MKKFITKETQRRVEQAIQEVECKTDAELVVVVAKRADDYYYIPTMWAAFVTLLWPGVSHLLGAPKELNESYVVLALVFIVSMVLLRIPFLMYALIPRDVKQRRARSLAYEQFLVQNLHATKARTGVLIFVSIAERYVKIIADKGINDKITDPVWQNAVIALTEQIKKGNPEEGFLEAIRLCSQPLIEHFPASEPKNELSNHLVIL
ncbi:TPM domain-containing protein [Sulfurimonas sp. HSL3-2]|uniref:TPM domain-containing protein n=1 Tax=Hydrocurvibacter mobilis TaxID=3131936 RepID=UPI0031F8D8AA